MVFESSSLSDFKNLMSFIEVIGMKIEFESFWSIDVTLTCLGPQYSMLFLNVLSSNPPKF